MKLHEAIKMENRKMMHRLEHHNLPGKLPLLFMTDNKGNPYRRLINITQGQRTFPNYQKPKLNCTVIASLLNALLTIRPYPKKLEKSPIENCSQKSTKLLPCPERL